MDYEIIENALTEQELEVINDHVLGYEYPWFIHPGDVTEKNSFSFLCHTLMHRNEHNLPTEGTKNSGSFEFFAAIFERLVPDYKTILRAAVNLTVHHDADTGTIHEDHPFEHKNLIIYLNESDAGTRLYDRDNNQTAVIPAKVNTAVKFSGKHAQEFPSKGIRVVAVFTYI